MVRQRVTIYDIAQKTGISSSTVSRVLNGSSLISEETRLLIQQAADELGYEPRRIKRQRTRRVCTLALVMPQQQRSWKNLFYDFSTLIGGITDGLAPGRAQVLIESGDCLLDRLELRKGLSVDAVMFAFCRPEAEVVDVLKERGIPSLLINRSVDGHDSVNCDHEQAAEDLVHHVMSVSSTARICFIDAGITADIAALRLAGIHKAAQHGLCKFSQSDAYNCESIEEIDTEFIKKKIAPKYDIIIGANDSIGLRCLSASLNAGLTVPDQLQIVGFDASIARELQVKKLSSVTLPVFELGLAAGKWAAERVIDREEGAYQELIPVTLSPGSTCLADKAAIK